MTRQQFHRLILLVLVASFAVAGAVAFRDFNRIYQHRLYVYEPWGPQLQGMPTTEDAYRSSLIEWRAGYDDQSMLRIYRNSGYQVCYQGFDYLFQCTTDYRRGAGSFGITYPLKRLDEEGRVGIPALVKRGEKVVVEELSSDLEIGQRTDPAIAIVEVLRDVAGERYTETVRDGFGKRVPIWLSILLAPNLILLLLAAVISWVRHGRLPPR